MLLIGAMASAPAGRIRAGVRISELMYHPASEDVREEYIELHNPDPAAVSLGGWRFTRGIQLTFPEVVLPGHGYLVVAADPAVFASMHPEAALVVGGWEGRLSNSGETLELADAQGQVVQSIRYADEGDWAVREPGPIDYGHRGLVWSSPADGGGASIELVNPAIDNSWGQNWLASAILGGTPGRVNSVHSTNTPPFIQEVRHFPAVPKSTQTISITALVIDESADPVTVRLHYRGDGSPDFSSMEMLDDGHHGDGSAGDHRWGALLTAQPHGTIVEFFVEAADATGLIRTWPAPVNVDGQGVQRANALCQVDDEIYRGRLPLYRLILTAADQAELRQINRNTPAAPYSTSDQTRSHAQFNGTFIGSDASGAAVRYLAGVRNRGNGSRYLLPASYRVNFRSDEHWKEVAALNLNAQHPHAQLAGSAFYQRAGLPVQQARAVQVRVNGVPQATPGSPSFGFHVANEVIDSQFAERQFPLDSSGNIYRGIRIQSPGANLSYLGEDPDRYRVNYFKQSNVSEDDWADLIGLAGVLDDTPDDRYAEEVRRVLDVEEWMLYFALETLVDNRETNLANGNNGTGDGDDYFLYAGVQDPRFRVLPYDLDTIMGQGNVGGIVSDGLFRMAANPRIARLLQWPDFAPLYYEALLELLDGIGSPAQFNPLIDQVLGELAPASNIAAIQSFIADRGAFIRAQIPLHLTASNSLPIEAGAYVTTNAAFSLAGAAHAVRTRSILVGGQPAQWEGWRCRWVSPAVPLTPGFNHILVEAADPTGQVFDRIGVDVRYDLEGAGRTVAAVGADTVWRAADSPYRIDGLLTVPAGVTLAIEPGATVYFADGAGLLVQGRIDAAGRPDARIRFTRLPGLAGDPTDRWAGLDLDHSARSNRLACVDFAFAGSGGFSFRAIDSAAEIDRCTWSGTTRTLIEMENSSLTVRGCVLPSIVENELVHGVGILAGGCLVFEENVFGTTTGYNDIIDFSNARRPGPILQVLRNVFTGSSDDMVDLDGADAHIEGNLFVHGRHSDATGEDNTASAVSFGQYNGYSPHVVVVRNLAWDVEHFVLCKEGGFVTIANNTVIGVCNSFLNLDEPGRADSPGRGAIVEGNVYWNPPGWEGVNFENAASSNHVAELTAAFNIFAAEDRLSQGPDNQRIDPHLVSLEPAGWPELTNAFRLRPGSPAIATGPNGLDRGALVPSGASISGEPFSPWPTNRVTLRVAGPGIVAYRYRLNDDPFGEPSPIDTPLELLDLANGAHRVEVLGQNSAGAWQSQPTRSRSWTIGPAEPRVVLNEILVRDSSTNGADGPGAGWIELHNEGAAAADLEGVTLEDGQHGLWRFVFPAGVRLDPGAFLLVLADADQAAPGWHTGASLPPSGGSVRLAGPASQGGPLLDHIRFGMQVVGLAIGRGPDGQWTLTSPTPAAPNRIHPIGDSRGLRINEWLAEPRTWSPSDYIEIYNSDPLPVGMGGFSLTDEPVAIPNRHILPPLGFLDGFGHAVFLADGRPERGDDHLDFKLASEQGSIALSDDAGIVIDHVIYGPQTLDIAEGRLPSGGASFARFVHPSPGAPNPGIVITNVVTTTIPLITTNTLWRYEATGLEPDPAWSSTEFDDLLWPAGLPAFAFDADPLPAPILTPLSLTASNGSKIITFYFRAAFIAPSPLPPAAKLRIRMLIDDGAAFYLNGSHLHRVRMPGPPYTSATRASPSVDDAAWEESILASTPIEAGTNVLAVEVHQYSSSSADVVFSMTSDMILTTTNVTAPPAARVRLHEILAGHRADAGTPGPDSDWIEIHNPTSESVDLGGLRLTDHAGDSSPWVFPSPSIIGPDGYRIVRCDSSQPPSDANTGFGLDAHGDAIFLFGSPALGGALLDAVRFGLQIPNQSIGISPESGLWALTDPTPGTANRTAFLGDPSRIRINEWMAHPAGGNDWFELFNSGSDPVEVSGWWVTDDLARPLNHPLPPLSFLGAGADAWRQFEADNDPGQGAHHVGFRLDSQGESIGVFLPDGSPIDGLHFGPQIEGVSEGRWPDGQNRFLPFPGASSPGAANRIPAGPMRLEQAGWRSMGFHFLFEAAPGQAYAVQANEGLADDGWTDLIRIDAGTESRWIEVLDPAAPGSAARFYRLIALDPPMSGPELR